MKELVVRFRALAASARPGAVMAAGGLKGW
jgi:hypothetical protein